MTSLYDFSVSGLSFGASGVEITPADYLGSGVVAVDYDSAGVTTKLQGGKRRPNFYHSIDQAIDGDQHTISLTVSPTKGRTFSQSIPSRITSWDGSRIDVNAIQFDVGNFYRGQWGDVVEGYGEVDGLDLDLPWTHPDAVTTIELTYSDGYVLEVDIHQVDEIFPEAMDTHTEHDEIHYTPTVHFDLTEPESGRSFGDAVSATFKETFDVSEGIESNGQVRLYRDGYDIHVQDASGDWHDVVSKGKTSVKRLVKNLSRKINPWQLASAETIDGVNELLFLNSKGTKSRVYYCDEDWDLQGIGGSYRKTFKGRKHRIKEDEHQIDFNNDGVVEGSDSYNFQVFFAQADVDPATESIGFVGSTSAASDAGSGMSRDSRGKARYKHSVKEMVEDNVLTIEKTVMPVRGKTFYESIRYPEKNLTSWDGTEIATNALQFDFGNFYNGQWGIGEVDGIDVDRPWDHADATSTYTLTFKDGSTQDVTHPQSYASFNEGDAADWDELHFSPIFAFDLPADDTDLDGLKLGDAVSVTFKESYVLADMVESAGSIHAAETSDGSTYVQDEDNVWHDITGAADELTNHLGSSGDSSSKSISDWILAGAETVNGINQLVYSSESDASQSIHMIADDLWNIVSGSASTVAHEASDAFVSLESRFGIDFDGNSLVGGISSEFFA